MKHLPKKGYDYVTVAVDLQERKVLFVTEDKNEKTIDKLKEHFEKKEVSPDQIKQLRIDMSPAFIPMLAIIFQMPRLRLTAFILLNSLMKQWTK